ncbi:MAG: AAA family ATPase [uncultured DHVE6 group euryarchaeote]|jgi:replicative DNA helicase Mcm|nr:MAG: AAA family ATPase [uncultured DHVE6 group euryarchaeote]
MESKTLTQYRTFIEKYYKKELLDTAQKGGKSLQIDWKILSKFNPELAENILMSPKESLEYINSAIAEEELGDLSTDIGARIVNLPQSQKLRIRDLRSKNLGQLVTCNALIRQASDIRPMITIATFECPKCGSQSKLEQHENKLAEPGSCGQCRHKGKFKMVEKNLSDVQQLVVEEPPESLEGGAQPKRIRCILHDDLLEPGLERNRFPGNKIKIVGIVKEVAITTRTGAQSTKFDIILEANSVESMEEEFEELDVNSEEIDEILKLAKDPKIYEKLIQSIAPVIYGYEEIKESIVLQLFGGIRKVKNDGTELRGDIHILLMGDPGAGKSILLRYISHLAPKARYVAGRGASGAGLTAAVVKDEFLGGWALEAGTLVLANKGMACIDELDKISHDDRSAMHEAMEQQTVSISKANIQATLLSQTSVLAAANPKYGRFDPYQPPPTQIDLPPTLINRFDLMFVIRDIPNIVTDERIATHVLKLQGDIESAKSEIEHSLLRKYIAYAKQTCFPKLGKEPQKLIRDYYVKIRSTAAGEDGIKSIPISARQLQAIIRLAEASAKVRLSKQVTKEDAERAIRLVEETLKQLGTDPETGKIDIDRITSGITATERSRISSIKQTMTELEAQFGKAIPKDDLIKALEDKGMSKEKIESELLRLKKAGEIFEPRHGVLQKG